MRPDPPPSMSLYDRNIELIEAVADIFGFTPKISWDAIKKRITPDRIRALFAMVGWLWNANLEELVPERTTALTALYLGDIDPERLARRIFRFGLYTDHIYVIDPFQFPVMPGKSPIDIPEAYRFETLKLLAFLQRVEPWIRARHLTLIADPMKFDSRLRAQVLASLAKRQKLFPPGPEEIAEANQRLSDELRRQRIGLPREMLIQEIKSMRPSLGEDEVAEILAAVEEERKVDPLALDDFDPASNPVLITRHGTSLEAAMYICSQTGAFPFTYTEPKWRELLSAADEMSEEARLWSPLTNAFQGLEFQFLNNVDPAFAARIREEERLLGFRQFLSDVWAKAKGTGEQGTIERSAREFRERLTEEYRKAQEEWQQIDRDVIQWGLSGGALVALGNEIVFRNMSVKMSILSTVLAITGQGYSRLNKRRGMRVKVPMSIFVDLSTYRNRTPGGMALAAVGP